MQLEHARSMVHHPQAEGFDARSPFLDNPFQRSQKSSSSLQQQPLSNMQQQPSKSKMQQQPFKNAAPQQTAASAVQATHFLIQLPRSHNVATHGQLPALNAAVRLDEISSGWAGVTEAQGTMCWLPPWCLAPL